MVDDTMVRTLLIESTNASLFTTVQQKDGAETVILLRGRPGIPMDFSPAIDRLSRRYQVVSFDQRGTGRSPAVRATYSIGECLDDIDAIARHIGFDKFHLFGHSWGGMLALEYALTKPAGLAGLVLADTGASLPQWSAEAQRLVAREKRRAADVQEVPAQTERDQRRPEVHPTRAEQLDDDAADDLIGAEAQQCRDPLIAGQGLPIVADLNAPALPQGVAHQPLAQLDGLERAAVVGAALAPAGPQQPAVRALAAA
ncbi:MAG: alpha/beta fold hydrolase, partial [Anaerolineales bacterium]|nr:alpha/beta fold hydrolase [Anaerolineales bacterium]